MWYQGGQEPQKSNKTSYAEQVKQQWLKDCEESTMGVDELEELLRDRYKPYGDTLIH